MSNPALEGQDPFTLIEELRSALASLPGDAPIPADARARLGSICFRTGFCLLDPSAAWAEFLNESFRAGRPQFAHLVMA